MSLAQIASLMKTTARKNGTAVTNLPNGAHLTLKYARVGTQDKFVLIMARPGKAPATPRGVKAWTTEQTTFSLFFVPGARERILIVAPERAGYYSAAFEWTEPSVVLSAIPRNAEEIKAWARTLGQGVKVSHVDLSTGELPNK